MANLLFLENTQCGEIGEKTKYHLLLDRCVEMIYPNPQKAKIFTDVLLRPLLTAETIYYRQNILQDFVNHPQLLQELTELFGNFENLKNQFDSARRNGARFLNQSTSNNDIHGIQNLLKMNALILKKALILVRTIGNKLEAHTTCSQGLEALKQEIQTIVSPKEFEELLGLCTHFEHMSQTDPLCVLTDINDSGKIGSCCLANPMESIIQTKEPQRKGLFFKKKEVSTIDEGIVFQRKNGTAFQALLSAPYKELIYTLGNIYKQIDSAFSGCYIDLQYYGVAVKYCRFLLKNGFAFTYPSVSSTQETHMLGIRDLFLVLKSQNPQTVIANDYVPIAHNTGTVIFGKNSGGKTVYMRSVGISQILAQAGLPIVAKSATIHCYKSIITQFAQSEKTGIEGGIGRFEQEAKEMAQVIDMVTENSLVLFNEVFQSTSYEEGAVCLADILDYISSVPSKWILVTHLQQIRPLLPFGTMFLTVGNGYKIKDCQRCL